MQIWSVDRRYSYLVNPHQILLDIETTGSRADYIPTNSIYSGCKLRAEDEPGFDGQLRILLTRQGLSTFA